MKRRKKRKEGERLGALRDPGAELRQLIVVSTGTRENQNVAEPF